MYLFGYRKELSYGDHFFRASRARVFLLASFVCILSSCLFFPVHRFRPSFSVASGRDVGRIITSIPNEYCNYDESFMSIVAAIHVAHTWNHNTDINIMCYRTSHFLLVHMHTYKLMFYQGISLHQFVAAMFVRYPTKHSR